MGRIEPAAARLAALVAFALSCGLGLAVPAPAAAATPDYADPANWLCWPGRDDVCAQPLTSTELSPADERTRKTYVPDPNARIDCFYVYPTVSREPTANADMAAGAEEKRTATEQLARFGAKCRTYAPLYRQTTVAALRGEAKDPDFELAYGDVLAAWRSYLARDNHGRGVVLIGHSQGAGHLIRLIAEEIDGKPAERLLVSAIIAGGNAETARDADVGGSFRHVPLCRRADQSGCVIAYSSFLASRPPGPGVWYGKPREPGLEVACVNPAELLGRASLDAELLATPRVASALGTVLVETPGALSAACVRAGGRRFLAVTVKPTGRPAETLGRALEELDSRGQGWGLHPVDLNLALGDLVEIVGRQAQAWSAAGRR